MHCDIDQVASIEHIPRALEEIGVDRIGHGTNNIEDQRLIEVAKSRGIGFTCCALSNSFVTRAIGADQILQLLRFFADTYTRVFGFRDPPLHDPCAVAFVIAPEIFKVRAHPGRGGVQGFTVLTP